MSAFRRPLLKVGVASDPHTILLPLPRLPDFSLSSPDIVTVLDSIRSNDNYDDEFYLFAREYPRVFRYHLGHVEHRLENIYNAYKRYHDEIGREIVDAGRFMRLQKAIFTDFTEILYWDFEALLNAVSASLDILARIASTAHAEPVPANFNKYLRRTKGPIAAEMHEANIRWVRKLKDYRDCFVHYTPVDRLPQITATLYSNGVEIRCRLPINPNVRETLLFRYSRRLELLRYAIYVYRSLTALDRAIGRCVQDLYARGEYPARTKALFGIGARRRLEGDG